MVNTGDTIGAVAALEKASQVYEGLDDRRGMSEAKRNLGRAFRKTGQLRKAKIHYQNSLQLAEKSKDSRQIALVLNELGKLARDRGELQVAKTHFDNAMTTVGEIDNSVFAGICAISQKLVATLD